VAIKTLTHQRYKQLTGSQLPAVRADSPERRRRIQRTVATKRFTPAGD